jgi:long-chain acyl-CoA synthetase
MSLAPDTIVDALLGYASERPEARAIVGEHRTITYGELAGLVGDSAALLASQGIRSGECVGVTIPDDVAHVIVVLALATLGASYVVLPTFDDAVARSRLAARVGVRRIVVAEGEHRLSGLEPVTVDARLVATGSGGRRPPTVHGDPAGLLTYFSTSGTTGEAKLLPILQGRMAQQARRASKGCLLMLSPIEYHFVQRSMYYSLFQGEACALRGRSRTPVARLCALLRVDAVGGMVGQVRSLLGEAELHGRLPPGTQLRATGARSSARFRSELLTRLCDTVQIIYAAQECGHIARMVERDPRGVRESVGPLVEGAEVQIVDEKGAPLPPGEIGEIRMRAPGMSTGYHGDAAATACHFRDGWFQPGDAASIAPDGDLHVYGRADDVMNMNGIKIAPLEIERALERHPAVKAVVAFPLRSPAHGEIPVAAVELVDGARADEGELQAFARRALGLRAPRRVKIVPALPMTPFGKFDLQRLAAAMRSDSK